MIGRRLNNYGFEKPAYDECKDLIKETDRRHMELLNLWFLVVACIYLYFSWQNSLGLSRNEAPWFLGFLIIEAIGQLFFFFCRKLVDRIVLVAIYLNIAVILSFGILCSVSQPYMAATIYLVALVIVALSYIDVLWRMGVALFVLTGAFLYSSYLVKPDTIFKQDIFNVVIVFILAMILHFLIQQARMRQFITFMESERMKHELEVKSSFDGLTQLLNRARFFSMAREVLKKESDDFMVLGLIDLDKFKQINDTLGHQMGDKVIQTAGKTILDTLSIDYGEKWSFTERAVKENLNFAGRLGGDEFVVFIRNLKSAEEVEEAFKKILKTLNDVRLEGVTGINASIGVTIVNRDDSDVDKAYSRADEALYQSKEEGRNRVSFSKEVKGVGKC